METMENDNVNFEKEQMCSGLRAVKNWISDTVYEGSQVLHEHKKAILTVAAIVAAIIGIIGGLCAFFGRRK